MRALTMRCLRMSAGSVSSSALSAGDICAWVIGEADILMYHEADGKKYQRAFFAIFESAKASAFSSHGLLYRPNDARTRPCF